MHQLQCGLDGLNVEQFRVHTHDLTGHELKANAMLSKSGVQLSQSLVDFLAVARAVRVTKVSRELIGKIRREFDHIKSSFDILDAQEKVEELLWIVLAVPLLSETEDPVFSPKCLHNEFVCGPSLVALVGNGGSAQHVAHDKYCLHAKRLRKLIVHIDIRNVASEALLPLREQIKHGHASIMPDPAHGC
jgi:hypothetical protein